MLQKSVLHQNYNGNHVYYSFYETVQLTPAELLSSIPISENNPEESQKHFYFLLQAAIFNIIQCVKVLLNRSFIQIFQMDYHIYYSRFLIIAIMEFPIPTSNSFLIIWIFYKQQEF